MWVFSLVEKGSYERSRNKLLWSLNQIVNTDINLAVLGFHVM